MFVKLSKRIVININEYSQNEEKIKWEKGRVGIRKKKLTNFSFWVEIIEKFTLFLPLEINPLVFVFFSGIGSIEFRFLPVLTNQFRLFQARYNLILSVVCFGWGVIKLRNFGHRFFQVTFARLNDNCKMWYKIGKYLVTRVTMQSLCRRNFFNRRMRITSSYGRTRSYVQRHFHSGLVEMITYWILYKRKQQQKEKKNNRKFYT